MVFGELNRNLFDLFQKQQINDVILFMHSNLVGRFMMIILSFYSYMQFLLNFLMHNYIKIFTDSYELLSIKDTDVVIFTRVIKKVTAVYVTQPSGQISHSIGSLGR